MTKLRGAVAACRIPAGCAAILLLAACDGLLDTRRDLAESARVRVTGTAPQPFTLILSNNYVGTRDPADPGRFDIQLLDADTVVTALPIDRTLPVGDQGRIFVRLLYPDSATTADVHMRVLLDDQVVYDQQATLRNASLEYVFVYF